MVSNAEIGVNIQSKFELYLLTLTFTILGLSIQTSNFDKSTFSNCCELVSWVLFLISGFISLNRHQWIPVIYGLIDSAEALKENLIEYETYKIKGGKNIQIAGEGERHIEEVMNETQKNLEKANKKIEEMNDSTSFKFKIHLWTFYAGFVALVLSRSVDHVKDIFITVFKS